MSDVWRWFRRPPQPTYAEGARDSFFQTINWLMHDYEQDGFDVERIILSPTMFKHMQHVLAGLPLEDATHTLAGAPLLTESPMAWASRVWGIPIEVREGVKGVQLEIREALWKQIRKEGAHPHG